MKFWVNVNLLINLGHTTRQEVCSHLGITLGHLSLLINGKRNTNSAKMERVAELLGYPITRKSLKTFVLANQIGTVISTHGGENVFAYQMPDGTLEPVCPQGGILVFDADVPIEAGNVAGMVYAGRVLVRKAFLQSKHLILQSPAGVEPPQVVGKESLINCFRAVECIKKL